MIIKCSKRNGYKWYSCGGSFIRGYIQMKSGEVLREAEAVDYFKQAENFEAFCCRLSNVYGCYCIIVSKGDLIWAAVDIARSMPLYYSSNFEILTDRSEVVREKLGISEQQADSIRLLELYASSYISGRNTAYGEIKQLEAGTAIEFSKEIQIRRYYAHNANIESISSQYALERLKEETEMMLIRLRRVIADRWIVISLSGGYDSRYVACSLKENGFDNVICYTYGKMSSFEIKQSKIVARALGYEWHCVEYTDADIRALLTAEDAAFFDYCRTDDYAIYLQNYIAVKKLVKQGAIPDNAFFLTGLCNDMPTGQYIPEFDEVMRYGCTNRGVAEYMIDSRFVRVRLKQEIREQFADEVENQLRSEGIIVNDYQSFVSALDVVMTDSDHSRRFLHMNDAHDFFGYEWLLPCWDKDLLKLWYSLPVDYRIHQNLYETYVTERLGTKYGVGTKKERLVHSKSKFIMKVKRLFGGFLVQILYPLGISLRRKIDINNFAVLEVLLYNLIKQKEAIISERAAVTMLLDIYTMEQKYGSNWYSKIIGFGNFGK